MEMSREPSASRSSSRNCRRVRGVREGRYAPPWADVLAMAVYRVPWVGQDHHHTASPVPHGCRCWDLNVGHCGVARPGYGVGW